MPVVLNVGELERRVLSCNPLLESFGNAVTLKNDNSSRFEKLIKIQFDKRGRILGAQVQNLFLEKTRIVDHAKRERSYHVFYQMLAGASSALKKELRLENGVAGFECLRESSIMMEMHGTLSSSRSAWRTSASSRGERRGVTNMDRKGFSSSWRPFPQRRLSEGGFDGVWWWRVVDGQEEDAWMIDEKTRGSLNIAGELLGVDADA
ncbi:unnamed protein product, partial [Ascophyllum nodosum]